MTVADPYRLLREEMVEFQLAARGIRDERVLKAMREVPRERFVDLLYLSRAYDDSALPIGWGQTISQPYMVAVMTEALELKGTRRSWRSGRAPDIRRPFSRAWPGASSRSSGSSRSRRGRAVSSKRRESGTSWSVRATERRDGRRRPRSTESS